MKYLMLILKIFSEKLHLRLLCRVIYRNIQRLLKLRTVQNLLYVLVSSYYSCREMPISVNNQCKVQNFPNISF